MNSIIVRTFMFVGCGSLVCKTTMTAICPLLFWGRAEAIVATIIAMQPSTGLPEPVI
ncbi:MAG: hypothetical protein VB815_05165 [Dehalococcoidia bacterium]